MKKYETTCCGNTEFHWGERTYVMGIINLSPESFSGDGVTDINIALAQAARFVADGADMIDIGGITTRPGSIPDSIDEEITRIVPVIERLHAEFVVPISIDTSRLEVARHAFAAGATIINDQWGLKQDPLIAKLAAERGAVLILMSNQRDKGGYDSSIRRDTAEYTDPVSEVIVSLRSSMETALRASVPPENIILDPGIGFGKSWQHDLELIRRLRELTVLGRPLLVGPSRKSFIGMALNLPVNERLEGTASAVAIAIANGADIIRVHDVKEMARVCRLSDAIVRG